MLRILIVYLAALFTYYSHAQQPMLICTPHLNELVNAGIPRTFIFQRGDNYCAAIADNSAQVVEDGITWLLNKIKDAFIFTGEPEFDYNSSYEEKAGIEPYEQTAAEWLAENPDVASEIAEDSQDNLTSLNGMPHYKKSSDEAIGWLDAHLKFWDLEEEVEVE